jgi:hypothetical protein
MCKNSFEKEVVFSGQSYREFSGLFGLDSQAAHACIYLDVDICRILRLLSG